MATVTKRGKSWVLNWHDASGQHRVTIGRVDLMTRREADALAKAKDIELASHDQVTALGGRRVRVGDALNSYLLWRGALYPDSNAGVERELRRLLIDFNKQQLDHITTAALAAWVVKRRDEIKLSSLIKQFNQIKTFLRWCDKHGFRLDRNALAMPAPRNTVSAPIFWYTAEQLQTLYSVSGEYAAWWKLIANTGLRRVEALNLLWEDVKDDAIHVVSRSKNRTKSGRWRIVPLSPGAREALDALPRTHPTVLPPQTLNALTWKFKYYSTKAGVGGSLHKLRHTFASHLAMQGRSLRDIQQLLGHSSVTTTEIYAHLSQTHLNNAVSGLTI